MQTELCWGYPLYIKGGAGLFYTVLWELAGLLLYKIFLDNHEDGITNLVRNICNNLKISMASEVYDIHQLRR